MRSLSGMRAVSVRKVGYKEHFFLGFGGFVAVLE
jgi:hypothetical protein